MKKDIKQIIAEGESQQTEFKSSFNTEAMESIVAFANTEGGRVLIGVSNKGKIVGVVTNDESVQQWVNEIKSKTEPAILVDAERYEIEGKTVVVLSVPEYPVKPIALQGIIHRDYTSPMDVQIKVFDQKITFFSPGELYGKQTIEALRTDDYQAYTRNKLIAEAFYLTGDIEKYGTGYTRIRKEIEDYPTMKFEFEEKPSAWLVTISYEKRKTEEKDELATKHATELATNLSQLVTSLSVQVKALIINLNKQHLSFEELKHATELATKHATISRQYFSKAYIRPAFNFGLIAMLFPDNQRHPKQKYYLTEKGKEILNALLTQKSLKENEEKPPKKPSKMKENEKKSSKKPSKMKENGEKPSKKPSKMKENEEKSSKKPSKMKENGKKPSKKPSELAKNDEKQSSEFPSPIAKKVYEAIKSNRKAKYTWLQDNLGVSESSILRAINELKRLGYINTNPSKLNGEWQLLK